MWHQIEFFLNIFGLFSHQLKQAQDWKSKCFFFFFWETPIISITMGFCLGLYQNTFEWQPGHIKMAVALMDSSSLCLTALGLPADATQLKLFKRCKERGCDFSIFFYNIHLTPEKSHCEFLSSRWQIKQKYIQNHPAMLEQLGSWSQRLFCKHDQTAPSCCIPLHKALGCASPNNWHGPLLSL